MPPTRGVTINLAQIWGAGGGGAAPARTPLLSGGLRPQDPPKRRSAPLAAAVVRFFATEPLVRGRFFLRNPTFAPGQLRCLGQNCFQKIDLFFEEATCPGQLRCLGQNLFSEIRLGF